MDMILTQLKKMDATRLKVGGAALVFIKLFGIGKTLFFLLGGATGFLLATKLGKKNEDEE